MKGYEIKVICTSIQTCSITHFNTEYRNTEVHESQLAFWETSVLLTISVCSHHRWKCLDNLPVTVYKYICLLFVCLFSSHMKCHTFCQCLFSSQLEMPAFAFVLLTYEMSQVLSMSVLFTEL